MELFGIPGAVLIRGGAVAVLGFVVLAIIAGKLVPRKVVEDVRADRDARLEEANKRGDEWRAAAEAQDARNDLQAQQIQQLLDIGRTTNALVEGLTKAAQERRR